MPHIEELQQLRKLPVLNVSGEEIPAHAVMMAVEAETDGLIHVDKPNADSLLNVLVNGPTPIPAASQGTPTSHSAKTAY